MELNCNNERCKYNERLQCTCERIYYVNRLCVTYRKRSQHENIKALMQTHQANCHKSGGKYKADHATVLR